MLNLLTSRVHEMSGRTMAYNQAVLVSTFGFTCVGMENASVNSTYPVTSTITPTGHYVPYELDVLNPRESMGYILAWSYDMLDNIGTAHVSSIYCTSSGIATRGVTWDPSLTVIEYVGLGSMTTDVMIHERVFSESGNGAVTWMSGTDNNIAIHWEPYCLPGCQLELHPESNLFLIS